jgi:hypothetical protein
VITRSQILILLGSAGAVLVGLAETAGTSSIPTPGPGGTGGLPQLPPLPPSPIVQFRQLLEAGPEEQARQLATRPDRSRRVLEAKLREYQLLAPEERELRLRATELRWYLRPLMGMTPAGRGERVAKVPEEYRALIEERLQQWDQLPADTQREILEHETTIQYFLRLHSGTPTQREAAREALSPPERERLEREMAQWQTLPADRRQRMCSQFQRFFELPPREQQKTLHTFTPEERQQMEHTLQAFAQLPRGQRRVCVASFRKFAEFTPAERAEFLKSADRWKSLTPQERDAWRKLVTRLPPLPPPLAQPPMPPLPPQPPQSRLVATSGPPPLPTPRP